MTLSLFPLFHESELFFPCAGYFFLLPFFFPPVAAASSPMSLAIAHRQIIHLVR
jgi:hypothetical protein